MSDGPLSGALVLDAVAINLGERFLFSVDCVVPAGTVVTILGPSGIGKSSLLAFISGTLAAAFSARGDVWLDGTLLNDVPPEQRRTGLLFQDDLLFPHLSVAGNLGFALPAAVRGTAARRAQIDAALTIAGLDGFGARDPATLSGGQRARVSVLRTLLSEPKALLLDEPFSKLDPGLRAEFRRFVFDHARERALPVLLVTHDEADAKDAGGAVIVLG